MLAALAGKQRESVQRATRHLNVWEGSVRSGKTIASMLAWLRYVRNGPAGNLLMSGKTERTLRRNIIDPLTEILGQNRCRYTAGAGELHLLGRRIYVASANDESAQDKIRGLTLAGAYCDEVSTWPESFWSMLLTRLSIEDARLFATTNPDSPNHWLKCDYLDRAALHLTSDSSLIETADDTALDLARFSFRLADNPHLPAAYVANLSREFVGLWHKRFVLGEWVLAEGAIYDMWDPDWHVVPELPKIVRWIALGVDYGTANPFDALLLALGDDGRLYLAREWRHNARTARRQLTDVEYSERVRGWLDPVRPEWTCVDPSAASFITQLHRDGLTPTLADNSVLDGIRTVSSLLASGHLLVHESCRWWIEEASGYSWDDKAGEKGEDKPIKVDDHAMDAGRYAIHTTQAIWRLHLARDLEEAA